MGCDFFAVLGIPLRAGRPLGAGDDAGSPPVVVVNEAFVRAYFRGQDPLGRRVNGADVVGVAADSHYGGLRESAPPTVFVPAFQQPSASFSFQVRAPIPAVVLLPRLRQAVQEVAPTAALHDLTTPEAQVRAAMSQERLVASS